MAQYSSVHSHDPLPPHSLEQPPAYSQHDDDDPEDHVHIATLEEKKRRWWRNAFINTALIASWYFFATILSVYNKWMFSKEYFGFPFPLFVTMLHMYVQFLLAALLRVALPHKFRPEHSPSRRDYAIKVVPTGITTSLDIGLSNLSLKLITLSFYTMVKSSSLIFVLIFAFIFRLEVFSLRLIGVITLIFSGVLLMVATETHFVLSGFLLVLSGSALGGLRWALTQVLLKDKKLGLDNPVATIFWLSPIMGVTLSVVSLILDRWSELVGSRFFDSFGSTLRTCFLLTVPGVLAFCMILSEVSIIQRAGVVPMSIAGIAKEVSTITISAWFFGDVLTPLNITGVAVTVCGIALFTYHKYRKSIDSNFALDAHGNPISDDDPGAEDAHHLHVIADEERQPLAASVEQEEQEPYQNSGHVLFDLESDSEGGDGDNADDPRTSRRVSPADAARIKTEQLR
ncbi:hypothetical protein PHLGIDRAFT_104289 [Phlebiopsis gigantea 11061_1 CR5-6]|uniref:Sugar phosphate transporter domain-containing protein n=1 Tax=Phlebiopsis gigantea (strain 11061_1 CR5-6) TaxID=745531 RepID=A0A0C3SC38_PHLG1|nr:hypothetical protein PHLGIDRAFT_104289 [Phlebiopsis gigantea 11061_1 CR5-6]